jgi:hypothetical protein
MRNIPRLLLCTSLALVASGCDTISGVRRSVTVQRLPSPTAVTAALRAVPGVTSVERRPVEPSTGWSLYKGVIHDPPFDQFLYRADRLGGVVKTRQTEDGTNTVELYQIWMNYTPPRKVFDDTRSLMDAVYASLRRHSHDLPPTTQMKETLIRYPRS